MITGMVTLRDVIASDLGVFFDFQDDPVANEMAAFPARDRAAHDAHWAKIVPDPACVTRTIADADVVVGNICSWVMDDERLVGYWIGREYWGRGVASHALQLFVADVVPQRPLFAHVVEQNLGSIRVLEKVGFTAVGRQSSDDDPVIEIVMKLS